MLVYLTNNSYEIWVIRLITMEKLIEILKQQLKAHHVMDIIQVGERELNLVLSSKEDLKQIRRLDELVHQDSEIQIKGVKINFVDQYGAGFEQF